MPISDGFIERLATLKNKYESQTGSLFKAKDADHTMLLVWLKALVETLQSNIESFHEHSIIEYVAPKAMAISAKNPDFFSLFSEFIGHWDNDNNHAISNDILHQTQNIKINPNVNTEFNSAQLFNEVMELLQKQRDLQTSEVNMLKRKNEHFHAEKQTLESENSQLKKQVLRLQQQLRDTKEVTLYALDLAKQQISAIEIGPQGAPKQKKTVLTMPPVRADSKESLSSVMPTTNDKITHIVATNADKKSPKEDKPHVEPDMVKENPPKSKEKVTQSPSSSKLEGKPTPAKASIKTEKPANGDVMSELARFFSEKTKLRHVTDEEKKNGQTLNQ
jgi:hypothetical protein